MSADASPLTNAAWHFSTAGRQSIHGRCRNTRPQAFCKGALDDGEREASSASFGGYALHRPGPASNRDSVTGQTLRAGICASTS